MNNKRLGDFGEALAVDYLNKKGYRILETKFRTKSGEIDIIASYCNELVFIEVKTRTSNKFGTPAEAVTAAKQQRISQCALEYLQRNDSLDAPVSMDVIEIMILGNKPQIHHIQRAF